MREAFASILNKFGKPDRISYTNDNSILFEWLLNKHFCIDHYIFDNETICIVRKNDTDYVYEFTGDTLDEIINMIHDS